MSIACVRHVLSLGLAVCLVPSVRGADERETSNAPRFVDLSLLVGEDYPSTWPAKFPKFQLHSYQRPGPLSPYHAETLLMDPNTGTQMDVPPHSIPKPDSGLPNAGPAGLMFSEQVPAWQFCGNACVVDCSDLLPKCRIGQSALITKDRVLQWEKEHRELGPGDVVLFRSGYSDKYYGPLPEGRRFVADPVEGLAPAWPDPDVDCMAYLASRGVKLVGTDSPSMGPLPPKLAEPTHVAGLKHGVIFTESLTGLGELPDTGAFYAMLAPKHVGTLGSEVRAIAIVGQPLAAELIKRAEKHQVVDLSLPLQPDLPLTWPGAGVGHHRQPFLKMPFEFNANVGVPFTIYLLDSHTGTHLVPPAYALLAPGEPNLGFAPDVRGWLDDHERKFGKRPTSAITTEQVPLSQTCGTARFLDVRPLIGTTQRSEWPASPLITPKEIQRFESEHGKLLPGEVLVLKSGWSDRYCKPGPEGAACLEDPVSGVSEGWPALSPEAVLYLAERGIRCVATDGPTIGGVDPRQALMTYSLLGAREMVAVEYLTNLEKVPDRAYFLFAPIKIQGGHGGHGRALAIY